MNKYDLTVLVKKTDGLEEKVETLVKVLGGKAGRMVEMGKKQMAYVINKSSEANYLSWGLDLPTDAVVQLEKKLTNDKDILRHLLVKIDK
jgi:ribosomal protein S6